MLTFPPNHQIQQPITFNQIQQALTFKNYSFISSCLSIDQGPILNPSWNYASLPVPYDTILTVFANSNGLWTLEILSKALNAMLKYLGDSSFDGNRGELIVLKKICHCIFSLANSSQSKDSSSSEALEEAARQLSKAFTATITDRSPLECSKKWATLFIVNLLFRLYFSLSNTRLCMNIIRAIENEQNQFPPLEAFPQSEFITWCWFRARIHFHEASFEAAIKPLTCAYEALSGWRERGAFGKRFQKNKNLVVLYLIVAKMLSHGSCIPSDWLLQEHNFVFLKPLCLAVLQGNIDAYLKEVESFKVFFMRTELYLILQVQMKQVIYRNLFRFCWNVYRRQSGIEARLPIPVIVGAFSVVSNPSNGRNTYWDAEHVECIAANLIANSMIKGYISHEKQMIVLSKKDPFPLAAAAQ